MTRIEALTKSIERIKEGIECHERNNDGSLQWVDALHDILRTLNARENELFNLMTGGNDDD